VGNVCLSCGVNIFPPRDICPDCGGSEQVDMEVCNPVYGEVNGRREVIYEAGGSDESK